MSRRKRGHFCWCCQRVLPNERFSGRNHPRHLCRDCTRLPAEEREHRQAERDLERLLHDGFYVPRRRRAQFSRFLDHPSARVRELARGIALRGGLGRTMGLNVIRERGCMDLKTLKDNPPWDWPKGTGAALLGILGNAQAAESDRVLAAELAGDSTVIDDDLAEALLAIVRSTAASEMMRGRAAISLGPALEQADIDGFEDAAEAPISERSFRTIQESLREVFTDASTPEEVRRRILEASVRAPQDWHQEAVRAVRRSDDEAWKVTGVFCMRFVRGFDEEILQALASRNPDIHYQAVRAAGAWGLEAAWPHVAALITSKGTAKRLLLAAIEAVSSIRPQEASRMLVDLAESDDEDIVEAVDEALAMAEGASSEDDEDEDFRF